jgi:tRNA-(ms[2]io[6]A)-hydroxylase
MRHTVEARKTAKRPQLSPMISPLRYRTEHTWADAVLADFARFLQDHAAAEKKATGKALSKVAHYPDKPELVTTMVDLAVEELSHYREVIKWLHQRGCTLGPDAKDAYVLAMRNLIRKGPEFYLLDRLLTGGIIEARGAERFGLVAEALEAGPLKQFYRSITRSEERHFSTFVDLAYLYFERGLVDARLDELLDNDAAIVARLPVQAALH